MSRLNRHVLAIDLGTGGPKVALVSETGKIAASAQESVATLRTGSQDAEQDANGLWSAVVRTTRRALEASLIDASAVVGVICVSQYSSVVPVDGRGEPTANLILWRDSRGGAHALSLYGMHPTAIQTWITKHGAAPLPSGADSLSHMLHIKNDRPEVYARTRCFLEAMDFLNLRLTGRFCANAGSAFMMLLTDNRELSALKWDEELIALSGIDPKKLPELTALRGPIGEVNAEAAEALGIRKGVPVFASMNDTCAAAIGTQTFLPGRGGVNIGTTCQILAHIDRKHTDTESELVSMPSPIAGKYTVLAENGLGGGALQFFLNQVAFASDALGGKAPAEPFAGLEATLRSTSAGSRGVLFLPWLGGAQCPAAVPEMRGGFINVSLDATRADFTRAVLEGVAFNLKHMLGSVEKFASQHFERLAFSGGGAVSQGWAQILADVLEKPILQLDNARYVNNAAASLCAFHDLGGPTLDQLDDFCPVRSELTPSADAQPVLRRMYEQFLVAFERLQPIARALN